MVRKVKIGRGSMKDLTKCEAQELMAEGKFVSHRSEPGSGYKLSRVGNVESHDGRVLSACEFWHARVNASFDAGWRLLHLK